jgi:DNA-binding MurR/RpiR family transcriptional regulator
LQVAARHLEAAGFPDFAHELRQRSEQLMREMAERNDRRREGPPPGGDEGNLRQQLEELRRELRELRSELRGPRDGQQPR